MERINPIEVIKFCKKWHLNLAIDGMPEDPKDMWCGFEPKSRKVWLAPAITAMMSGNDLVLVNYAIKNKGHLCRYTKELYKPIQDKYGLAYHIGIEMGWSREDTRCGEIYQHMASTSKDKGERLLKKLRDNYRLLVAGVMDAHEIGLMAGVELSKHMSRLHPPHDVDFYTSISIPKGSCTCGAHSIGCNTHSHWCDHVNPRKKGFKT